MSESYYAHQGDPYRIVQLGNINVYRVEHWTKRWFRNVGYWKRMTFEQFGYPVREFRSVRAACDAIEIQKKVDLEESLRAEHVWLHRPDACLKK